MSILNRLFLVSKLKYVNPEHDDYLAGIVYGGIRTRGQNMQFGYDSESIRHMIQNRFTHDGLMYPLKGAPWILKDETRAGSFYYNYSNYIPYTYY